MSGRRQPTLKAKLAAAIRELLKIPYEHAKSMTEDQILSLVEWHHIHYYRDNFNDNHWNLDPLPIKEHRERTARIDLPQIGKTKRLTKEHEAFRALMLTPRDERPAKKSRWGTRPFPKRRKA